MTPHGNSTAIGHRWIPRLARGVFVVNLPTGRAFAEKNGPCLCEILYGVPPNPLAQHFSNWLQMGVYSIFRQTHMRFQLLLVVHKGGGNGSCMWIGQELAVRNSKSMGCEKTSICSIATPHIPWIRQTHLHTPKKKCSIHLVKKKSHEKLLISPFSSKSSFLVTANRPLGSEPGLFWFRVDPFRARCDCVLAFGEATVARNRGDLGIVYLEVKNKEFTLKQWDFMRQIVFFSQLGSSVMI